MDPRVVTYVVSASVFWLYWRVLVSGSRVTKIGAVALLVGSVLAYRTAVTGHPF